MLRKNVDLDNKTIAILQIEATLNGFGSLKPYLERIITDKAAKLAKERPKIYADLAEKKAKKMAIAKRK